MQVRDPGGNVRGLIEGPFDAEKALKIAMGLRDDERLMMVGDGEHAWALVAYRPNALVKPVPLGPRAARLSREARAVALEGLIDEAWQDLVDEGWTTAEATARQSTPE